jgi:hypothetical protein
VLADLTLTDHLSCAGADFRQVRQVTGCGHGLDPGEPGPGGDQQVPALAGPRPSRSLRSGRQDRPGPAARPGLFAAADAQTG